jgi:hypothetical protein
MLEQTQAQKTATRAVLSNLWQVSKYAPINLDEAHALGASLIASTHANWLPEAGAIKLALQDLFTLALDVDATELAELVQSDDLAACALLYAGAYPITGRRVRLRRPGAMVRLFPAWRTGDPATETVGRARFDRAKWTWPGVVDWDDDHDSLTYHDRTN